MPDVVTCLLMDDNGKVLILKRSDKVRTYKGLWGGVAGYVEEGEQPYDTALKEIKEEVGLKKEDIILISRGDQVKFTDIYEGIRYNWVIHPFLFKIEKKGKLHIDWEHSEYRWISAEDVVRYDTVPHPKQIIFQVFSECIRMGKRGGGEER